MNTCTDMAAVMQSQLFRYAQDLQELIDQHSKLQQRHQSALQSLGRATLNGDLLLPALLEGSNPYLVTDVTGNIVEVGSLCESLFGGSGTHRTGMSVLELVPLGRRSALASMLAQLCDNPSHSAIEFRQMDMFDGRAADSVGRFDVLMVPLQTLSRVELFWLIKPAVPGVTDELATLRAFELLRDSTKGMLMTDGRGYVCGVNPAMTRITGFAASELLGGTPKLLSSGRHDETFYKAFWDALLHDESWSGEFFNRRKDGQIYPEWKTIKAVKNVNDDTVAYLSVVADISHQNDHEQLALLAYQDALTGLPNRRLLEDRLTQATKQAQRSGTGFSLLYLDLDHFKPINDTLGHEVGDRVLQEVSARLIKAVRQCDTAARVGGDEFVIFLQNTVVPDHIEAVVNAVLTSLTEPINVGSHELMVGASVGCAIYPKDADNTALLLKFADRAMYAAKCFGGNHFCFHDANGDRSAKANLGSHLWKALDQQELHLVYQPQVTQDGQLRGCEALLRWSHPTLGEIPPATFIPIAETNGAIVPIGDWVLEAACRQLKQWRQAGMQRCVMSVNVAARQLAEPGFAQRVGQALARTGVDPQDLELEITESAALQSEVDGQHLLQPLRALGVKLAIDDFGIGYSSLSRLQFLPIDCLKIDQSFVRNLANDNKAQAICQCFIGMGLAMGMEVIAEGVETAEQHRALKAQGCQVLQGYLTGRPMTPDALLACYPASDSPEPAPDLLCQLR